MKRTFSYLTFLSLFFIKNLGKNPDNDIVILYTNDVHCGVNETIGYAGLSYYKNEVNKKTPYVSLVDAGDHVQGGLIGSLSQGNYLIDIMNAVGYDVVTPGNHEFDYGMDQFKNFTRNLSCGYISCNFRNKDGDLILKPYDILEYNDVKVAFVGISTPESLTKVTSNVFKDNDDNIIYDFDIDETGDKLIASVQESVNNAKKEGADFVIALGHLGETGDVTKIWSSPYIVERTTGIDAFIDGHTHEVTPSLLQKNMDGKEVPITQSGSRLANIGQVTIKTNGEIVTELIKPDQVASKDEKILDLINEIQSSFDSNLNEKINHVDFDLVIADKDGNRIIRKGETNLGDLVADSLLDAAKNYGGADIAFCNSGNIRVPIKSGDITYGDILNVLAFDNEACIVEVTGQSLMDALEMSAKDYPEENGGFLQTSGLTYAIDPDIISSVTLDENKIFDSVSGQRRVHNIKVNGEPIDAEKKYKVLSSNYLLLENGNGYVFDNSTLVNNNIGFFNDFFVSYIEDLGEDINKYKESQERVVFTKRLTGNTSDDYSSNGTRIQYNPRLYGLALFVIFILYRRVMVKFSLNEKC